MPRNQAADLLFAAGGPQARIFHTHAVEAQDRARSAGFQACRVADFQVGRLSETPGRPQVWKPAIPAFAKASAGRQQTWKSAPQNGYETSRLAFSLIEILVTVALLSFIILGLVAMFVQTQRAFKIGMSDTDMLDIGRAMTDLIGRELSEMRPSQISNTVNFFVEIPQSTETIYTPPLYQGLPGTGATPQLRTNFLEPFFFLSHPNMAWPDQTWVATGYYVVPDTANIGIGTLYRYSLTNILSIQANGLPQLFAPWRLFSGFANAVSTLRTDASSAAEGTVTRVADGVVHLQVRAFATNGFPVIAYGGNGYATVYGVSQPNNAAFPIATHAVDQTVSRFNNLAPDNWTSLAFYSNAVPAYLEVELGVLDPQTYQRYKGLAAGPGQVTFLSNRVAQVHLFRQRIPIHNVDPAAYK